jgi:hypothetical protein
VKWVEVVEVVADAAAAPVAAAVVDRVGWVALRPPDRAVTASAPTAGTGYRTWWANLAIRCNAQSAVHR